MAVPDGVVEVELTGGASNSAFFGLGKFHDRTRILDIMYTNSPDRGNNFRGINSSTRKLTTVTVIFSRNIRGERKSNRHSSMI